MPHLCLTCVHASEEVPSEVIVGEMNIADDLKAMQGEMKKIYKHALYCSQEKAIVVGGDSPAQQRKECDHYAERT